MKISDICEDFSILSEIVDRGSRKGEDDDLDHDSDPFYREGTPARVSVEDEHGHVQTGMVYLCPLCNGKGKNILKTAGRLNAEFITQQAGDLFGGGCGVNRRDYRCVNGLMQDKSTGEVFWPDDAPRVAKEKQPKDSDNIKVSVKSFKDDEPELWNYMITLCNRYKDEPDRNSSSKAAYSIYNDLISNKETTQSKVDLLRRKHEESKQPSKTMSDTLYRSQKARKLGFDPNKDKKGYAANDKVQQTFRPKKT